MGQTQSNPNETNWAFSSTYNTPQVSSKASRMQTSTNIGKGPRTKGSIIRIHNFKKKKSVNLDTT